MSQKNRSVGILGIGSAAPEKILTNFDLEKIVETSDEWIRTRTGIQERRICAAGEAASDFGHQAAARALEDAGLGPEDVDLIICATFTSDETIPSTACRIQQKFGVNGAAAFDLNAACTGFVYALTVAKNMILGRAARRALVVGAEAISAFVDYEDRNTCVLFGDGAGAVVLGEVSEGKGMLGEYLAADGAGAELIITPAGGSRKPASVKTVANREHYLRMAGNEVFKFAVRILGESVEKALEGTGFTIHDLDYVAPHQANIRIIEAAAKRLNMPMERMVCNIDKYGNTSAASIPLALDDAVKAGQVKDGDLLALVAFGSGMTWGSSIIRWGK